MSEFPDWLEDRLPSHLSYREMSEIREALRTLDKHLPGIVRLFATYLPPTPERFRQWPFWRRWLWFVGHT